MARRFRRSRKSYGRRRRRTYRRHGAKALRMVRALSRKVAAEVKKVDNVALVLSTSFQMVLGDTSNAAPVTLRDFGHLYNVFGTGDVQGIQLDDFIGEQVRAKYLYVGLHLQYPTSIVTGANVLPTTLRVLIVQDRNYEGAPMTVASMFRALFGVSRNFVLTATDQYAIAADSALLPLNPQQPGRFKILRDFSMNVAPGWRQDYYKKVYIRQRELLSRGRIYYGVANNDDVEGGNAAMESPPGDATNVKSVSRNALYVFSLFQSPVEIASTADTTINQFFLSIQTRFAYYDN